MNRESLVLLDAPPFKLSLSCGGFLFLGIYGLWTSLKVSPGYADAIRALHQDAIHAKEYSKRRYANDLPVLGQVSNAKEHKARAAAVGK